LRAGYTTRIFLYEEAHRHKYNSCSSNAYQSERGSHVGICWWSAESDSSFRRKL